MQIITKTGVKNEPVSKSGKDYNSLLFEKLYSKIALALGVTPTPDLKKDSELMEIFVNQNPPRPSRVLAPGLQQQTEPLLAIYNPGQYLPAQMDPVKNIDDRYTLSTLFNVVPQFNFVFSSAAATVSQTYESVLNGKETPIVSLTKEQKEKLQENVTFYAEHEEEYREYMYKYLDAMDAYDAAYATQINGGAQVPRSLKLKLKDANNQWIAHHKEGVESAVAVIAQYEAFEPAAFWKKMADQYKDGTKQTSDGSDFQVVNLSPPYKSWFESAGWTKFTFDQKDMDNQQKSDVIGVAGELSGNFGMFKISGGGDYHKDEHYTEVNETSLNFTCELMRVSLDRSWMNPLIYSCRAWRWTPAMTGVEISSGADLKEHKAPSGVMTVIPTTVILSRKMKVKGSFTATVVKEMNQEINANASVGFGPFAISGKFNMEHHEGSVKGSIASNEILADDVQIVALICEILPKCPNPDNTLLWPSS